jgi:hypothetical protein
MKVNGSRHRVEITGSNARKESGKTIKTETMLVVGNKTVVLKQDNGRKATVMMLAVVSKIRTEVTVMDRDNPTGIMQRGIMETVTERRTVILQLPTEQHRMEEVAG